MILKKDLVNASKRFNQGIFGRKLLHLYASLYLEMYLENQNWNGRLAKE